MSMWREAGWHPKCRLFAARVRSPCAGTIVLSKRVITSTVLQVFAVALERWSDLESQPRANSPGGCLWLFLAVHSRRWLLTGVGSSGLPCLWRFFNAAMGRETNWRVAVVSGSATGTCVVAIKKLLRMKYKNIPNWQRRTSNGGLCDAQTNAMHGQAAQCPLAEDGMRRRKKRRNTAPGRGSQIHPTSPDPAG